MNDRVKRAVFHLLTIVLVWAVVEAAAVAGYGAATGRWFSPGRARGEALAAISEEPAGVLTAAGGDRAMSPRWIEVIHPYVGVVVDPWRDPTGSVSELGFVTDSSADPILRRDPGSTRIGFFGGSFAVGLYRQARSRLVERLASIGETAVPINFSKGGYKQPQQLMILAWLLAQGAELDVVINVDGFNEVAVPTAENVSRGVNPFFPRQWHKRARSVIDLESVVQVGRLELLKERRNRRARWFVDRGLYKSPVLTLGWRFLDRRSESELGALRHRIDRLEAEQASLRLNRRSWECLKDQAVPDQTLAELRPLGSRLFYDLAALGKAVEERIGAGPAAEIRASIEDCVARISAAYAGFGPRYEATEEELYRDLVAMWQSASFQMRALCEAHGIRYYHFLQPNQYVAGSKAMSEAEKRVAMSPDQQYRPGAERGYPLLREAGRRLVARGVDFSDLTMIFQHTAEAVYDDDCCHLNPRGSEIVMNEIAEAIVRDLQAPSP